MIEKSIEIYYDVDDIVGDGALSRLGPVKAARALKFRNAAMHHIEVILENAGAGSWEGAEIGMGEINFGFSVKDFDVAEKLVRDAVQGTRFENIREISRREFDFSEYQ